MGELQDNDIIPLENCSDLSFGRVPMDALWQQSL